MKANPTLEKNVNKVLSFGPDILLAVPRALLTSKLSGYVNKALFGKKKDAACQDAKNCQCKFLHSFHSFCLFLSDISVTYSTP